LGWRAFAWGAVLGTLPDLDSFIAYGGPVADFTFHRGYTHALLVQTLASLVLSAALARWHRHEAIGWGRWLAGVWLVFVTHALLDAATIYGTQLWLPFSDYPVGLGSVFIIDPLYTLPLVIGVAGALLTRGGWQRGRWWNGTGLAVATIYLAWTILAQQWLEVRAREALTQQDIPFDRMLVTPTAFNSVLWRVVAVGKSAHWEGFYTIGSGRDVGFTRYPNRPELLAGLGRSWAVERLRYFTKGFYSVNAFDGDIVMTDLRMGQAGFYAFAFRVAELSEGRSELAPVRRFRYPDPPIPGAFVALKDCMLGRESDLIRCGPGDSEAGASQRP
jgi:inner membrane protein